MKMIIFLVGAAFLFVLCYLFGIDRVGSYIQILSAVPWFWTVFRLEQLHKQHKKEREDKHVQ
jgi:hypothetical protein